MPETFHPPTLSKVLSHLHVTKGLHVSQILTANANPKYNRTPTLLLLISERPSCPQHVCGRKSRNNACSNNPIRIAVPCTPAMASNPKHANAPGGNWAVLVPNLPTPTALNSIAAMLAWVSAGVTTSAPLFLQYSLVFIVCASLAGAQHMPALTEVTSCTVRSVPSAYVTALAQSSATVLFNASCDALMGVDPKHGHERCSLRVQWPNSRVDETCKHVTFASPVRCCRGVMLHPDTPIVYTSTLWCR
jgi:hypothetical protein